jgi:hypothetical protein
MLLDSSDTVTAVVESPNVNSLRAFSTYERVPVAKL